VITGGLLAVGTAVALTLAVFAHRAEPFLRARIVQALQERFHARVELDSFHLALRNGLQGQWGVWAEGKGLRIWPLPNWPSEPNAGGTVAEVSGPAEPLIRPLIQVEEFRFHAPLRYEPGKPFHISVVELKGLDVSLPPKSYFGRASAGTERPTTERLKIGGMSLPFGIGSIECRDAHLTLETSKPGKLPLQFAIARLNLTNAGAGRAMGFDAELTNPRPVGTIHSQGSFGPWETADPGASPVTGDYRFEHADLAGFEGIAGILSSTGHYQGTLRDLAVDGETDTPDFRLTHFGNALPLHTKFHAQVDGTNGDTWLQPVEATLGHSHFTAEGQIVRVTNSGSGGARHSLGHDIALTVHMERARVEDFLRLTSRSGAPLLAGAVTLKTTLHIPPGTAPVHERLRLNGAFTLDQARFSSAKIQGSIEQLSLRGQGRPKDAKNAGPAASTAEIQSRMEGDFQMAGGVITLPSLTYTVPGATIVLKGTYGVEGGALDFTGNAKMAATVSEMVGGWKGMLLKPVDRYFKKDGAGTEIPIHIDGTREAPHFGVDFGRMKSSSPEQPGQKQP
jgi:hypothetical protein